jgi:hypothetical protein
MCFEARRPPKETESTQRLTSEDVRELFERYGSRQPEGLPPERTEEAERRREPALSSQ